MTSPSTSRGFLARRILEVCERHEGSVLLADPDGALTGEECRERLASFRRAVGEMVPEGGAVGVLLPPSAAQAFAVVAVLASGRVPMVLDPRKPWPPEAAAGRPDLHGLVICEGQEELPGLPVLTLGRRGEMFGATPAIAEPARGGAPLPPPEAGVILATSGSSGEPKTVVLPAAGLVYTIDLLIRRFGLGPETVSPIVLPLHHTMGLNTHFLPTFLAGGRSIVFETGLRLSRTFRDVLDSEATFVSMIAPMLRRCRAERALRALPAAASVREVQIAGGAIETEDLRIAKELFPAARLHKGYGLTEAIRVAMIGSDEEGFEDGGLHVLPEQEVVLRDRQGGAVAAGRRGEIWLRGPNVMLGYAGEGESPLRDGFLATGDLGHLDEAGRLVVRGRRDRTFKSYGHRVAAREVEVAVLGCQGVADACCIPVPCPDRGLRPLLFVEVPAAAGGAGVLSKAALEAALLRRLDPFKVPKEVVVVEELPRTGSGKADIAALTQLWGRGPATADLGRGPAGCQFLALAAETGSAEAKRATS